MEESLSQKAFFALADRRVEAAEAVVDAAIAAHKGSCTSPCSLCPMIDRWREAKRAHEAVSPPKPLARKKTRDAYAMVFSARVAAAEAIVGEISTSHDWRCPEACSRRRDERRHEDGPRLPQR